MKVGIGLMGHGVVGSGVVQILNDNIDILRARTGCEPVMRRILDLRDFSHLPYGDRFTTRAADLFEDDDIKIVVECMGGVTPAGDFVEAALRAKKHVVTSNKELVVARGMAFESLAKENGVSFLYEASVGGGIPIIRPLKHSLAANRVTRVVGILNGTTNYILTRMHGGDVSFEDALKEAQGLGYAEQNPSADVLGWDARRKISILAHVAFGAVLDDGKVYTEGIDNLTREDMLYAQELRRTVKLVALAEWGEAGWTGSVAPMMLPEGHPLSVVSGVFNAVMVHGNMVDDVMFYGRGAGTLPTASAVWGDIIELMRRTPPVPLDDPMNAPKAYAQTDRLLRLFVRVPTGTPALKEQVQEVFSGLLLVERERMEGFAFVTPEGPEDELRLKLQALSARYPLSTPIIYASP